MEIQEIVLVILSALFTALFTILFTVVKERKLLKKLLLRFVEFILFVSIGSLFVMVGNEKWTTIFEFLENNLWLLTVVFPSVFFILGGIVAFFMIREVFGSLK